MTNKKKKQKLSEMPENSSQENTEITAEQVDASYPTYNNCIFYNYNIESAFMTSNPALLKQQMTSSMSDQEAEELRKRIIEYVANVTSFSPEIVERVLDMAEQYMKENFGGSNDKNDLT